MHSAPSSAAQDATAAPAEAPASTKRHRRHANPFTVRHDLSHVRAQALFDRQAPLAIDVGCGPGLFVQQLATAYPHFNVLGLEIRPHLVAATETLAAKSGLSNVRCLLANANLHLASLVEPGQVSFLSINFPDPWYKKRHHKRRVVNADWLREISPALAQGAFIHAMSDYLPVALHMRCALREAHGYQDQNPGDAWPAASTTGLTSEREQTHMGRGEPIYRMAFRHVGGAF